MEVLEEDRGDCHDDESFEAANHDVQLGPSLVISVNILVLLIEEKLADDYLRFLVKASLHRGKLSELGLDLLIRQSRLLLILLFILIALDGFYILDAL